MKVALVCPNAFSVWQVRRGLIKALSQRGISVHVICADDAYVDRVKSLGVVYHPVHFSRFINATQDALYLASLWRIFRSERFDVVHNCTVKPNVYGAIAAKLAGVSRIIAMVVGLGFTFSSGPGFKNTLLRQLVKNLYRIGFRLTDKIWFVNKDDMTMLISSGIAKADKSVLIPSSAGLDLSEYSSLAVDSRKVEQLKDELGFVEGALYVSMIVARLVWSKGVREFVEASEELLAQFPQATFLLVGGIERDSPQSVPESFVSDGLPGNVRWLGFRDEVREILALSDIVVLPSYYGEGLPHILLEAMAMSRPIVTTDNVGCREAVENGRNGYLVPVRDSRALAHAIKSLLLDDSKRTSFGRYSRLKVENEFDENPLLERVLEELYHLPAR